MSATDMKKVYTTLKAQLGTLDIPGAVIALGERMSYSLPPTSINCVIPEPADSGGAGLEVKITEPHRFPKSLFGSEKRFSIMLEILHHNDQYFGYGFFSMKTLNIATYDVLRMLLSNALYAVYRKEGKAVSQRESLQTVQISQIIPVSKAEKNGSRPRLTLEQITTYLTEHLEEQTNLEKMAGTLMVSRSLLCKKTKELTGLSVQTLHEKLKIEQAKNMLLLETYSLSEIASTLGFANQNYFSNVFKKNTGLSPRNWLNRQK
jgi:AraC-like DNA-binding protein